MEETRPLGLPSWAAGLVSAARSGLRLVRARLSPRVLTGLALAGILAAALSLRLVNVNWDDGTHLHPDERHITSVSASLRVPSSLSQYFDTSSSPLNPYNHDSPSFVYGTLPIFLNKVVSETLDWSSSKPVLDKIFPPGSVDKVSYDQTNLVGRGLAAFFDVGTVLLIFLIGRRLYGTTGRASGSAAAGDGRLPHPARPTSSSSIPSSPSSPRSRFTSPCASLSREGAGTTPWLG